MIFRDIVITYVNKEVSLYFLNNFMKSFFLWIVLVLHSNKDFAIMDMFCGKIDEKNNK